jgi:Na+-translocating ferredoxin:NAD+ oxidoreductase RnfC subunit
MKEHRRVPLAQLRRRLQIEEYEKEAPFDPAACHPALVRIKMLQHTGQPAVPAVREGAKVKPGQVVGRVEDGQLGAHVHASITGKVRKVTPECVEIVA